MALAVLGWTYALSVIDVVVAVSAPNRLTYAASFVPPRTVNPSLAAESSINDLSTTVDSCSGREPCFCPVIYIVPRRGFGPVVTQLRKKS